MPRTGSGSTTATVVPKAIGILRRTLCQAAQAAVRTKNSHYQAVFRRLVPRLGYAKAMWAIVRRLAEVIWAVLHRGQHYQERGSITTPQAMKRRIQRLTQELRNAGYAVQITPPEAKGHTRDFSAVTFESGVFGLTVATL